MLMRSRWQILALLAFLGAAIGLQGCGRQDAARPLQRDAVDPQTGVPAPGTGLQY